MAEQFSRRQLLGMTAGAAAAATMPLAGWIYAQDEAGKIVVTAADGEASWKPIALSPEEARAVSALAETILPRTETPGAADARAHEFIDLELSTQSEEKQTEFKEGLAWVDDRCRATNGVPVKDANEAQLADLLRPLSDEHDSHPEDMQPGAEFFKDIKRRTIFAFYTSKVAWTQSLGRPEHRSLSDRFLGCAHESH